MEQIKAPTSNFNNIIIFMISVLHSNRLHHIFIRKLGLPPFPSCVIESSGVLGLRFSFRPIAFYLETFPFLKKFWKEFFSQLVFSALIEMSISSKTTPPINQFKNKIETITPGQTQWALKAIAILGATLLADKCVEKASSFLINQYSARWTALIACKAIFDFHSLIVKILSPKTEPPISNNTDIYNKNLLINELGINIVTLILEITILSTRFINSNPLYINAVSIPLTSIAWAGINHFHKNCDIEIVS